MSRLCASSKAAGSVWKATEKTAHAAQRVSGLVLRNMDKAMNNQREYGYAGTPQRRHGFLKPDLQKQVSDNPAYAEPCRWFCSDPSGIFGQNHGVGNQFFQKTESGIHEIIRGKIPIEFPQDRLQPFLEIRHTIGMKYRPAFHVGDPVIRQRLSQTAEIILVPVAEHVPAKQIQS